MPASKFPNVLHMNGEDLSVVVDLESGKVPRVAYWGRSVAGASQEDLAALVLASREPLDGNMPDVHVLNGIVPLESDGWSGRPGLRGFRSGGRAWAPRFALQSVERQSPGVDVGVGPVKFHLRDAVSELEMSLTMEIVPGGLARTRVTLTNAGDDAYNLEELGVAFPVPLEANEIMDMTGQWGREKSPQRRPVTQGSDVREIHHGRTGFEAPGFTFVGPEGFSFRNGEVWGIHTAFSGNHRAWVEKTISGVEVIGGSELLMPGEVTLQAGENYRTPWFYVLHAEGLDDAANRVRKRARAQENHVDTSRPVTLNVWEAVYFEHDFDKLKELADIAADVGVERFVLDDGWFNNRNDDWTGLGDWIEDERKWPKGLEPLAEYVHGKGMQFGIWMEPEMISLGTDLALEHPDWIMGAQGGSSNLEDLPISWRHQQVLNISIPAARRYVEERVVDIVQRLGVNYIKWDHNRDLIEAGDLTEGGRAATSRQTRAYYDLVDDIKARCPGLEIESCASGGGRIDLEVLDHTDRVWVSDCIDPVERQQMVRWTYQVAAPEVMGTHVASARSHTTGRWSSIAMRGSSAIWGHFGIEWDLTEATAEELTSLADWIAFYKKNRGFLLTGDLVRCETPDESVWLQGNVSHDRSRALFSYVTRERTPFSPIGRLRFAGLKRDKRYCIRPVIVGEPPSGLVAPVWFGLEPSGRKMSGEWEYEPNAEAPGIVTLGSVLEDAGVQAPNMFVDQALLFEIVEVPESE